MILEMGFLIKQDQMGRMLAQCMQRPGIVTWLKNDIAYRMQARRFSEGDVSLNRPFRESISDMIYDDMLLLMAPQAIQEHDKM